MTQPALRKGSPLRRLCLLMVLVLVPLGADRLRGDSGVLIPISEKEEPDPEMLSLDRMDVDVRIDNQYARTRIVQIFESHVNRVLEGQYVFDLPADASISDFAVWDGMVRIPGVILERRRARDLYQALRAQAIDPGLLQQGEGEDSGLGSRFTARIVPIPAFGTKRLELEYTQWVAVDNYRARFVLPLKPNLYGSQSARQFRLNLTLDSALPIGEPRIAGPVAPALRLADEHRLSATLEQQGVELDADLSLEYTYRAAGNGMGLIAHPAEPPLPYFASVSQPEPVAREIDRHGYFMASVLLSDGTDRRANDRPAGEFVLLMDTSLSMQWEKLEQSYQAVSGILSRLTERDRFNLVLFNRGVRLFQPTLVPAGPARIGQALDFIRNSFIEDGSNIAAALAAGLELFTQPAGGRRFLILVSDGQATLGDITSRKILDAYAARAERLPAASRPRLCAFGIGADANRTLLSELTERHDGFSSWARETEELDFALDAFLHRLGAEPVSGLQLQLNPASAYSMIYPVESGSSFLGGIRNWVGRFTPTLTLLEGSAGASHGGGRLQWSARGQSGADATHDFLPRAWARARVDALLRQIDLEGESQEAIEEIIRLSKRYRFVTPYTSFLAAPRALLRPRLIQPGDPILRIRTDEDIASVTAVFPFGLVKPMTYLAAEDVWQTRFLAPLSMADGQYDCRILLKDRQGRAYQERKSFVIDSKAPTIRATVPKILHAGETITLSVSADRDTRTLYVRLAGLPGVRLHWSAEHRINRGRLAVPPQLAPGIYELQITAEDFAHNVATWTRRLEVVR